MYQLCQKAAVLVREEKKERKGLTMFISDCIYFPFFGFRPLEIRTFVLIILILFFSRLAAGRIMLLNNQGFKNWFII